MYFGMRFDVTNSCDLLCVFTRWKKSSMSRFCTLRDFQFNHFNIRDTRILFKSNRIKISFLISTSKIPCSNLPNQVSTILKMVRRSEERRVGKECIYRWWLYEFMIKDGIL